MAMLPGAPPALSRTLEGQEIDSKKIDDCFKLYVSCADGIDIPVFCPSNMLRLPTDMLEIL
jgi:hypothetical protein